MALWQIIGLVWFVSGATFIAIERFAASNGTSFLWDKNDIGVSIIAYVLILIIAPVAIPVLAIMAVPSWLTLIRERLGPEANPFLKDEAFDQEPESFIADLMRRRKRKDRRLRQRNIGTMLMWQFRDTPEAMVLDVVSKYSALKSAGVADVLIWEKLEAYRYTKGEGELPRDCDLEAYVAYRLSLEDPEYLKLGPAFLKGQIALCRRYYDSPNRKREREWPPVSWLQRRLSLAEFEEMGDSFDPLAIGAPAALSRGEDNLRRDWTDLKFLMLRGDEVWTFASPASTWAALGGRAGVALVRNGKPVGHLITSMN